MLPDDPPELSAEPNGFERRAMKVFSCVLLVGFALLSAAQAQAQSFLEGVADRTIYPDRLTFQIAAPAGFDVTASLNGEAIAPGEPVLVNRPDYYELAVTAMEQATAKVSRERVRFVVASSERAGSETGLPAWTPHPSIPSTGEELAGSQLRLMVPAAYPADADIPVVAWVRNQANLTVRVNGSMQAADYPPIAIRRGVGAGFIPGANTVGISAYNAKLPGVQANRPIMIEAAGQWKTASGVLQGSADWLTGQRIRVTADLTIPVGSELVIGAGTIVRLDPGVSIVLDGRLKIEGTIEAPVVFAPTERGRPWGGIRLRLDDSELIATGAIFTGSGADPNWFANHGFSSHRGEECLFFCDKSPHISLTDCAAFDLAGQLGHSFNGGRFELTRCLVQRCTTGGEYTGSTWVVNDSAFIECPVDSPDFVDGDNDGLYLVSGTQSFTHTLFGWVKDDAIDCGGSGVGTLTLQDCWFESTFHEALALSGAKTVTARDSVFIDCGQGLEVGYSGPLAMANHCLATGNLTGMRFGDNYNWAYSGFLTVTNSILVNNYRDVFGFTWNTSGTSFDTNQWVERVLQMDVRDNYLTAANPYHPDNKTWNPTNDASRLEPFISWPLGAKPGAGFALRSSQVARSEMRDGIPVRLSGFSTNRAAVQCVFQSSGGPAVTQELDFLPGETLRVAALPPGNNWTNSSVVRFTLRDPVNCEISGLSSIFLFTEPTFTELGWARFGAELVLFWPQSGAVLESSEQAAGSWIPMNRQSPLTIPLDDRQQFFRLRMANHAQQE